MSEHLPFVTALCPTFRHPTLLASSVQLWLDQDYPADRRELVILDDAGTFDSQQGVSWLLQSRTTRCPSLPAKYNELLMYARPETEIFLVWEDDDTYLPGYVKAHVGALGIAEFSKPARVRSDYHWPQKQETIIEGDPTRFHSSMAFRSTLIRRIGGWPETNRNDFDQQLIHNLRKHAKGIADPWGNGEIQYVYGWHTGHAHCQSTMQLGDGWYAAGEQAYKPVPYVGRLLPAYDSRTLKILRSLGVAV